MPSDPAPAIAGNLPKSLRINPGRSVEITIPAPPGSSLFKQRWAELIKKVYEADPLLCPRCGGAMRIIAFIDQPDVIENILTHLGLWPHTAHAPPDAAVA